MVGKEEKQKRVDLEAKKGLCKISAITPFMVRSHEEEARVQNTLFSKMNSTHNKNKMII